MFETNVPLSAYSNYKIGGLARYFFQSGKIADLEAAVIKAKKQALPIFILGGGTNILFSDSGFAGLVIKPNLNEIKRDGDRIIAGAGASMADLLDFAAQNGLAGLEWAGGLPGSVGGAARGNAGAFGGEVKDNVVEVISLVFSFQLSRIVKRGNKECGFGYRDSIFKSGASAGREIILEVVFRLKPGIKQDIKRAIDDKISWRRLRQPLEYPNIGSIFKNVDLRLVSTETRNDPEIERHIKTDPFSVIPAAYLIHQAGLKGVSCGGAMVSPKHPNFIVNVSLATANDVKSLIALVKSAVRDKFRICLEEEVIII